MTLQTILRPQTSHAISASEASARNSASFTSKSINIYCGTGCFIKLGTDNTVTATTSAGEGYDKFIPAGQATDISLSGATYIAVILASGADTVYIHEWKNKAL